MQITIDVNKLSNAQKESFAAFLMLYLGYGVTNSLTSATSEDLQKHKEQGHYQENEPSPEQAFGGKPILAPKAAKHFTAVTDLQVPECVTEISSQMEAINNIVAIDKNGFPWDARIHSSNRAKTADGTWRKRRGIDDATVALVEAELRAVMGAPQAAAAPIAPPPPAASEGTLAIPASLVKAPPATEPRGIYVALIGRTAAAVAGGKITQEQVITCCQQFGVPNLPLLANRLDLVTQVAAAIDGMIAGV